MSNRSCAYHASSTNISMSVFSKRLVYPNRLAAFFLFSGIFSFAVKPMPFAWIFATVSISLRVLSSRLGKTGVGQAGPARLQKLNRVNIIE